jgi:hypothetical protein
MVIVEIKTATDAAPRYERLDEGSIRVGRAPDNDLIIEDPFVDAHHLQLNLTEDKAWSIHDLDSTNGTLKNRHAIQRADLQPGEPVKIGKTWLKVYDHHFQVASALSLTDLEHRLLAFDSWRATLALVTVLLAYTGLEVFLNYDGLDSKPATYLTAMITAIAGPIGVAAGWSLLSKLLRGESHLRAIFNISIVTLLVAFALVHVNGVIAYNLPGVSRKLTELLILLGIAAGYGYLILLISTRLKQTARLVIASLMIVGVLVSYGVNRISFEDSFSPLPRYDNTLYPPGLLVRVAIPAEEYRKSLVPLFNSADKLAAAAH